MACSARSSLSVQDLLRLSVEVALFQGIRISRGSASAKRTVLGRATRGCTHVLPNRACDLQHLDDIHHRGTPALLRDKQWLATLETLKLVSEKAADPQQRADAVPNRVTNFQELKVG